MPLGQLDYRRGINFSRNLPQRTISGTKIASSILPEIAGAHG
jgi:hypothetical protein